MEIFSVMRYHVLDWYHMKGESFAVIMIIIMKQIFRLFMRDEGLKRTGKICFGGNIVLIT